MSKKMNLAKMSNNSHASHMYFLLFLKVLFLLFIINITDNIIVFVKTEVIPHPYLQILRKIFLVGL